MSFIPIEAQRIPPIIAPLPDFAKWLERGPHRQTPNVHIQVPASSVLSQETHIVTPSVAFGWEAHPWETEELVFKPEPRRILSSPIVQPEQANAQVMVRPGLTKTEPPGPSYDDLPSAPGPRFLGSPMLTGYEMAAAGIASRRKTWLEQLVTFASLQTPLAVLGCSPAQTEEASTPVMISETAPATETALPGNPAAATDVVLNQTNLEVTMPENEVIGPWVTAIDQIPSIQPGGGAYLVAPENLLNVLDQERAIQSLLQQQNPNAHFVKDPSELKGSDDYYIGFEEYSVPGLPPAQAYRWTRWVMDGSGNFWYPHTFDNTSGQWLPLDRPDWATKGTVYRPVVTGLESDEGIFGAIYVNGHWEITIHEARTGKPLAFFAHDEAKMKFVQEAPPVVYSNTTYKSSDGEYPEEIKNTINIYSGNYPELSGLSPNEITIITAPMGETITILNYDKSFQIDSGSIAQIYDYFTSVASQNMEYDYEDAPRFTVLGAYVPNSTIIALIPSDLATLQTHTNKSSDGALPNVIYIKTLSQSEINPSEENMYPSRDDKTINSLENEICQATNFVLPMPSGNFTETDRLTWVPIEQEIYCNSLSRTYYLRQRGVSWEEYVRMFSGLSLIDPNTGKTYSLITFSKDFYNSIPLLTSQPLIHPNKP